MALVLDATVGGAFSNAYATVLIADAYHEGNLNRTAWTSATTAKKEAALVMATSMLDRLVAWDGTITTTTQARSHPRSGLVDSNGVTIDSAGIAIPIVDASSELAFWLLSSDRLADSSESPLTRLKVDVLEFEYRDGLETRVIPEIVASMISAFGSLIGAGNTIDLFR